MNRMKVYLLALFLGIPSLASATTIEMEVNGLVCAFCAQGIEKALEEFPATEAVFVSLEHRLVAVALKEGSDIDDASLRKALTDAGYTLVGIDRSPATLDAIRARVEAQDD